MVENKSSDVIKFPPLTLLLVVGSFLVFLFPAVASYLIYDREQLFAGEWWRLVTGILVHFSWTHLTYNAVILLVAGWLLEGKNKARFLILILATGLMSSMYFVLFLPDMNRYGGLSGIASAVVVYLCLLKIRERLPTRWIWVVILILFASKVFYESVMQQAFFVSYSSLMINVVPSTHIIGAMVAVLMVGIRNWVQNIISGVRAL